MGRGKHRRSVPTRPFKRLRVSILGGTFLGVLLFAGGVVADSSGVHPITTEGATANLNDGAKIQQSFLAVVGTGNLNPFVRIQATPDEDGYNTSHRFSGSNKIIYSDLAPTDDKTDPATQDLLLNTVPIVQFEGALFREFRLDLNEDQGSGALISLDAVSIWVGTHPAINKLNPATGGYSYYSTSGNTQTQLGTALGTEVWKLDAGWYVLMNSSLSAGSGNLGDARLLVPVGAFGEAGEECPYNPTAACDNYVYFYSQFGIAEPAESTFEEWSVRDVPFITKTVETSLTRTYPWTIEKSVDPDEHHLFDGDTDDSTYEITVTKGTPVDSDWTVSGVITITNPGDDVTIETVEDAIAAAGGGTIDATVECEEELPFLLGTGDSLVCTYEAAADPADTSNPFGDTNVASFTYDLDGNEDAGAVIEDVDFTVADVTEVNDTVDVVDEFDGGSEEPIATGVTDTETFDTYDRTFDCSDVTFEAGETESDTVEYSNTASVKSGETVLDDDTEVVEVTCYRPTISKDATTSFTRTYGWTIEKSVDPDEHHLFDGDTEDSTYEVTVTKDAGTDSGHVVSGSILITNPHPTDDMVIDDLSDTLTGDATAVSITGCTGTGVSYVAGVLTVPAAETADCDYTASVPGTDATQNTASFTLFGLPYSDTVAVTWGNPAIEVNDTVDVVDVFDGGSEESIATGVSETTTFDTYDRTFDCSDVTFGAGATTSDTVQYPNTASVKSGTTVLDDDSETVDVTCYRLAVAKTVNTSYTRDYDWSISKGRFIATGESDDDGDPLTLILEEGATHTASYQVVVTMTGYTDTGHNVAGVITVTNPAPMPAEDVVVTDVLSITGAVTVDCDADDDDPEMVDIPAEDSVQCSYDIDVADATAQTNVATATLFGIDYDSDTEDVTFGDPTSELDECIDVSDDAGTPGDTSDDLDLGTVCVDDLVAGSKTIDYTLQIGPYTPCGTYQFVNTASFATSDQDGEGDDTGTATYTVTIDVPCPTGCTYTLGYWQTHSIYGPAPYDDTWAAVGEDTMFFLSGVSWYEAIQANPAGNAYWILAQQYVAAQLNILTGAAVPGDVQDAFDDATALFGAYTPDQIDGLKGNDPIRKAFIDAADVLASYNEGEIGPGHCDFEEVVTATEPVQEASTIPMALTALVLALMATAARNGRYARREMLMS